MRPPNRSRSALELLRIAFLAITVSVAIAGTSQHRSAVPFRPGAIPERVSFTARVTHVVDGDTLDVATDANGRMRIRLEGIDCPEPSQPFGKVARNFTRELTFEKTVAVKVITTDHRYARLVARITSQGKDVSYELLKAGLAWHYTQYSSEAMLAVAEQEARKASRGLWADRHPTPPWVARRRAILRSRLEQSLCINGSFYGNTRSRAYHCASCSNAHCSNCTTVFKTESEARAAGYRPAGDCMLTAK